MTTSRNLQGRLRVIIPTYNAHAYLDLLIPALRKQNIPLQDFMFIDSSSSDGTPEVLRANGFSVRSIPKNQFNHGGTRRTAAELCDDAEFLIFLTQDAIPLRNDSCLLLVGAFRDPEVGLAYGRQLPRPSALAIERHARLFNYPSDSEVRSFADRNRLGVKTTFCSDSFAAYRRSSLMAVGNFPEDALFAEDQIVSGHMLVAGYKLAYVAEATVTHSHAYSIGQDFKRYFDVGVFHARNSWINQIFGTAEGEGLRFIRSEIKYVLKHEPMLMLSVLVRTFAKYLAYRLGLLERRLAPRFKRRLSMSPSYWCEKKSAD